MADAPTYEEPLLADPAELALRAGLGEADPELLDALRNASRRFVEAVGHPVIRVEADVVELDGTGTNIVTLPGAPVVGPVVLEVDGEIVSPSRYSVSRRNGLIKLRSGVFPNEYGCISVTASYGYTPEVGPRTTTTSIPRGIQAAVLEAAETQMNIEAGLTGRTVLGDTVQYGSSAVGSTQQWADAVRRYARA